MDYLKDSEAARKDEYVQTSQKNAENADDDVDESDTDSDHVYEGRARELLEKDGEFVEF